MTSKGCAEVQVLDSPVVEERVIVFNIVEASTLMGNQRFTRPGFSLDLGIASQELRRANQFGRFQDRSSLCRNGAVQHTQVASYEPLISKSSRQVKAGSYKLVDQYFLPSREKNPFKLFPPFGTVSAEFGTERPPNYSAIIQCK
jgi:hypothetical protein